MNKIPLLSIVVPTHNRSKYAYFCISTILKMNDERFELIVSDTSTDTELFNLLNIEFNPLIKHPQLKYFRPETRLDMTGNHNFVVSKAQGEYICLIGDDDCITIDALNAAEWAYNNNIEIIAPKVMANYVWPDFKSIVFNNAHSSRLYLTRKLGEIKKIDTKIAINSFLYNAGQGTDGLPKIYHGLVKKTVLDKINISTGNYFFGSSPDVSGAVALSLTANSFLEVSFPLTIPGASGGSNTGRSALNQHKGELKNENQAISFKKSEWSNLVPHFFSVETVWAHAAIETINKFDKKYLNQFNFGKLIALCQIKHPEFNYEINESILNIIKLKKTNLIKFKFNIFLNKSVYYFQRIQYIIKRGLIPTAAGGRKYIGNIDNIEAAYNEFNIYRKEKKWNWNDYISEL
jgi:glycosyltransferase involved in cell wall biosynthesis